MSLTAQIALEKQLRRLLEQGRRNLPNGETLDTVMWLALKAVDLLKNGVITRSEMIVRLHDTEAAIDSIERGAPSPYNETAKRYVIAAQCVIMTAEG